MEERCPVRTMAEKLGLDRGTLSKFIRENIDPDYSSKVHHGPGPSYRNLESRRKEIEEMMRRRYPISTIAQRLDCSRSSTTRFIHEAIDPSYSCQGVSNTNNRYLVLEDNRDEIADMLRKGHTIQHIADHYKVEYYRLQYFIRTQLRDISDAPAVFTRKKQSHLVTAANVALHRDRIEELMVRNLPIPEIAQQLDSTIQTATKYIHDELDPSYGKTARKDFPRKEMFDGLRGSIEAMVTEGMPLYKMALELGVDKILLTAYIRKYILPGYNSRKR